jgi:hypothetical protein
MRRTFVGSSLSLGPGLALRRALRTGDIQSTGTDFTQQEAKQSLPRLLGNHNMMKDHSVLDRLNYKYFQSTQWTRAPEAGPYGEDSLPFHLMDEREVKRLLPWRILILRLAPCLTYTSMQVRLTHLSYHSRPNNQSAK